MSDDDLDMVGIIARALREKFGDAALEVAEFQVQAASEESLAVWRGVVRALSMH